MSVRVPTAPLLLIQLLVSAPGKAAEDSPDTGAVATHAGNPDEVLAAGLSLA